MVNFPSFQLLATGPPQAGRREAYRSANHTELANSALVPLQWEFPGYSTTTECNSGDTQRELKWFPLIGQDAANGDKTLDGMFCEMGVSRAISHARGSKPLQQSTLPPELHPTPENMLLYHLSKKHWKGVQQVDRVLSHGYA